MKELFKNYYNSPIGLIEIAATETDIKEVSFIDSEFIINTNSCNLADECYKRLDEYFKGERRDFDLPLAPEGTEFQKKVWDELLKIPFGETLSYLNQAVNIGDKKAIRAVANANGQNKISIIIPCHRVIGTDGSLTGYAGGLWRKKWLLEHEDNLVGKEKQLNFFGEDNA
ncbi:cysteine methyltransferase [bacterium BRH_c32]|nr:MAG: cysteine methyltransferase [bacterium BRH_c32]